MTVTVITGFCAEAKILSAQIPHIFFASPQVATYERMETMLRDLSQAQIEAEVNTNVVHAVNWAAAQAGARLC
jgi:hypothetical protein